HHLWERPDHRYLLHELLADLGTGHHVVATVFLECHAMYRAGGPIEMRPVGETEFVAGIAAMSESGQYGSTRVAAGIVGFADLTRAFPAANIIVGHVGGPLGYGPYAGKRDEVFAAWRAGITELARCPNVVMKLGGMMMRLAAYDYGTRPAPPSSSELADYWRPYIEPCIEQFGAARCMFESNFPVEKMGIGYAALWNAFKRIAARASADEKLALFSGTARRAYRLA